MPQDFLTRYKLFFKIMDIYTKGEVYFTIGYSQFTKSTIFSHTVFKVKCWLNEQS